MRRLVEGVGDVGVVKDVSEHKLPEQAFSDARNMRFTDNAAERSRGFLPIFPPAIERPLWIGAFPPTTAPIWVYATEKNVYTVNDISTEVITRESKTYGTDLSRGWDGFVFQGVGIFNNGVDVPQMWTRFLPNNRLEDLKNWPANLRVRTMRPFKNFLVGLGVRRASVDNPYAVLISGQANVGEVPETWDIADPSSLGIEFDIAETPDRVVEALPLGDQLYIYKERSTWALQFTGRSPFWARRQVFNDVGIFNKNCALNIPQGHLVVTQDDIVIHNGQRGSSRSILTARMKQWLFRQIDEAYWRNAYLVPNSPRNEVWFCFPTHGIRYPNLALTFNWETGALGLLDLPQAPAAAAGPVRQIDPDETWAAQDMPWSEADFEWGAAPLGTSLFYPVFIQTAPFGPVGELTQEVADEVEVTFKPVEGVYFLKAVAQEFSDSLEITWAVSEGNYIDTIVSHQEQETLEASFAAESGLYENVTVVQGDNDTLEATFNVTGGVYEQVVVEP